MSLKADAPDGPEIEALRKRLDTLERRLAASEEALAAARRDAAPSPDMGEADMGDADRLFRALLDHATDAAFVLRVGAAGDFPIEAVNPACQRLSGLSGDAVVGRDALALVDAPAAEAARAHYRACIEGRAPRRYEERAEVGARVWETVLVPVPDAHGEITRIVGWMRDLTAERAAARGLDEAQRARAVARLSSGFAHDFNNLLTVITGNLERIQRKAGSAEPGLTRAAEDGLRAASRAAALTQRLLSLSRPVPEAARPIDVNALVASVSDLLRRTLGERIEVDTVLGEGVWRAHADAGRLEGVLIALAVNARDAMPEGGRLTIETGNALLDAEDLAAHPGVVPGAYVALQVGDSGAGPAPDMPGDAPPEAADGLGLSQVHGFLREIGGHMRIRAAPGTGTLVRLYLPRHAGETESQALRAPPLARAGGETVLVVEDNADVRTLAVDILRDLGYRVIEADDGLSGLRLLEQHTEVDLLFTDVGLPEMDGRELAARARALRPDLKILFATGYAREAGAESDALDREDLIVKPFNTAALAAKLRSVLDAGGAGRILVVEDESLVRLHLVEALEALGLSVDEAATGGEALALARAVGARFDAALVDIGLPDMSGETLVRAIKALRPALPILVASGHGEEQVRASLDGIAGVDFLSKPYDRDRIRVALATLGVRMARGLP